MKKRYELHYNGRISIGTEEELRKLTKRIRSYWELYVHLPSSMKAEDTSRMNIEEMREAFRLNQRGYTQSILASKYHVCEKYMKRVLVQMKSETL